MDIGPVPRPSKISRPLARRRPDLAAVAPLPETPFPRPSVCLSRINLHYHTSKRRARGMPLCMARNPSTLERANKCVIHINCETTTPTSLPSLCCDGWKALRDCLDINGMPKASSSSTSAWSSPSSSPTPPSPAGSAASSFHAIPRTRRLSSTEPAGTQQQQQPLRERDLFCRCCHLDVVGRSAQRKQANPRHSSACRRCPLGRSD